MSWEYDQLHPRLAYNFVTGQYLAVWEDHFWGFGTQPGIYGRLIASDGTPATPAFFIAWDAVRPQLAPDVAYDSSRNEFLVVYEYEYSAGDHDIHAQRVAANGMLLGSITLAGSGAFESNPAVTYNPTADEYLVVWEARVGSDEFTQHDIYAQRVSGSGLLAGSIFAVATGSDDQLAPAVAYGSNDNRYLVVWQENVGSDFDIYGQRVAADGSLMGGAIGIAPWSSDQLKPRLAFNSNANEFMVVLEHVVTSSNHEVYAQRVGAGGNLAGSVIFIADSTVSETNPAVAYKGPGNEYLVLWEYEYTSSDHDVYARRVRSDGTLPEAALPVSKLASWEGRPAVAGDTGWSYVVLWEDGRNSGSLGLDIYGDGLMLRQFSGWVYRGNVGDQLSPLGGVEVDLYCSSDAGVLGTPIGTSTSDILAGWFQLTFLGVCEFYNLVETDPLGHVSLGATSVDGSVVNSNWIQYAYPLDEKTLSGNKFWDVSLTSPTPTRTATASATPVPPPSNTPTRTASSTPTRTATSSGTPTASATGTRTATPTWTAVPTASGTATPTTSATATRTGTATHTPTTTATVTVTATPTRSSTASATPSASGAPTPLPTSTRTATSSPTPTQTRTPTSVAPSATSAASPTPTVTASRTPSRTIPIATTTPTSTPSAPRYLVVNTTVDHDDGRCDPLTIEDCTLREAMRLANEQPGPDTIVFDIPTSDPGYDPDTKRWTISPEGELPPIADDGTTINGASATEVVQGTAATSGSAPDCKVFKVELQQAGLIVTAAGGTVQDLLFSLSSTSGAGIVITGNSAVGNIVRCNTIVRLFNYAHSGAGVVIDDGAHDNTVDRNDISNHNKGVIIGSQAHDNIVTGNWISGNDFGVVLNEGAHGNWVGFSWVWYLGNTIVGNFQDGIWLSQANDNHVKDNFIGVNPDTGQAVPNAGAGILLSDDAAGNTIGPSNTIAYNSGGGVIFYAPRPPGPNQVSENSIHENWNKGILNPQTNPPTVTAVMSNTVTGTTSPLCSGCRVEIFDNPPQNPSGLPAQGQSLLGWVDTLADGTWTWTGTVPSLLDWVTATLTRNGDTSEFSAPARPSVAFAGKVCLGWQQVVQCLPDLQVMLVKKLGAGTSDEEWTELDRTVSGPDGSFSLADGRSPTAQSGYWLVLSDPRYRIVHTEASRGEVEADGAVRFTDVEPGVYDDTVFYVEEVSAERPPGTNTFSGTVYLMETGAPQRPLRGTRVSLYGSDSPSDAGSFLASARTGREGSFTVVALTNPGGGFPYYSLKVDDPSYVAVVAVAGPDGEVVDDQRIRIVAGTPGERGGNQFTLKRLEVSHGSLPPPDSIPAWDEAPKPTPLPGPPVTDLSILGIEITQAVQCFNQQDGYTKCPDNSLELTRGKDLAVRVYISHSGGAPCPVNSQTYPVLNDATVTLTWAALNGNLPLPADAAWSGGGTTLQFSIPCSTEMKELRNDSHGDGAATFFIPGALGKPGWKNMLWVRAEVNAKGLTETNTANNTGEKTVELFDRKTLDVRWALVEYRPLNSSYTGNPLACDIKNMQVVNCPLASVTGAMATRYPMAIDYHMAPFYLIYGSIPGQPKYCTDCVDVGTNRNPLYDHLDAAYGLLDPKPDALVGWLPHGALNGGWARQPVAFIADCSSASCNADLLAHEVGHTQGVSHMDLNDKNREPCWPFPGDNHIQEAGFDVAARQVHVPTLDYDFMSASGNGWISPFTWNKLLGKPYAKEWALEGAGCASGSGSSATTSGVIAPGDRRAAQVSQTTQPAVLISGGVHDDGTGEITSVYQLPSHGPFTPSAAGAAYAIELQTGTGLTLAVYGLAVGVTPSGTDVATVSSGFSLLVPFSGGTGRIVLRHGPTVLAERVASAHAPTAAVLTPQAGSEIGDPAVLSWAANDADGDALRFAVLYSADSGTTWVPLALDLDGTSIELFSSGWPGGPAAQVRILASDGFNTSVADSSYFHVPRKAPIVQIVTPPTFRFSEAIVLRGHAEDPEDGELKGGRVVWFADGQQIGTGSEVMLAPMGLSPGRHQLALMATDSDGQSATASAWVRVGCQGDCGDDGLVTVDEVLSLVNIALGNTPSTGCKVGDANRDGQITVDEILIAVNAALDGCG